MSEPENGAQPQPDETGAAPIIHLPDLSQPDPEPPSPRQGPRRSGKMKGRHFGPRPVSDPRTERIDLRVTPAQRAAFKAAAEEAGLSVAAFICLRTLGEAGPRAHPAKPDRDRVLLARMMAALGRSGNNLNQLLKQVNRYDFRGQPELIEMHRAMKAAHAAHHELVAAIKAELGV
jgi:uncharacterized protein (DUF1778 family)